MILKSAAFKPRNSAGARSIGYDEEVTPVLVNDSNGGGVAAVIAYGIDAYNQSIKPESAPCLHCGEKTDLDHTGGY